MNLWQIARQVQYLLRQETWPNSTGVIFDTDSVKIVEQGEEEEALEEGMIPPLAIIGPVGGTSDPVGGGERPSLVERPLDITLVAINQGDRVGEVAIVGGTRESAISSRGRGLLELEPPLFNAVGRKAAECGIAIGFAGFGAGAVRRGIADNWVAIQDYNFRAYCGVAKFYHPATSFLGQSKTGQVDLTWNIPPDRWDRFRMRLIRKTGAVAPISLTDGTEVTLPSNLPTSFSDTGLAADTYSYSLFASYSEFDTAIQVDDATSDPATAEGLMAF